MNFRRKNKKNPPVVLQNYRLGALRAIWLLNFSLELKSYCQNSIEGESWRKKGRASCSFENREARNADAFYVDYERGNVQTATDPANALYDLISTGRPRVLSHCSAADWNLNFIHRLVYIRPVMYSNRTGVRLVTRAKIRPLRFRLPNPG